MSLGVIDWVFILTSAIFLMTLGGVIAILATRREMKRIGLDIAHVKNNMRAERQAVEHFLDKQEKRDAE